MSSTDGNAAVGREQPGEWIGRYKLLQLIGQGGFGSVWMAEQEQPVRRKVALKIVKLGLDTRQVVARFEAERQALALMDHPCIAKVLDGGATDAGRPYFVMELVKGVPITKYCDDAKLSTAQRLALFVQVCNAVQHAHQKGVIHRDIKPSNVLVAVHDNVPRPKVIDFGIAKATAGSLTDKTMFTEVGQMLGTPEYMSPEQAEIGGLDVDTRADVYSLGVLLYELLTGSKPFDLGSVIERGYSEVLRHIREVEPQKPSTRISAMGDALAAIAERRSTPMKHLDRELQGDLDWIVMKAIEKDRARRYDTANALAEDIERWQDNREVLARPPSVSYRVSKFARRNKLVFAAGAAILLALVVGLGAASYGLVTARHERDNAREQLTRALLAEAEQSRLRIAADAAGQQASADRVKALDNERIARTEAANSAQTARFLIDMLDGVGPAVAQGRDTTLLREILDQTAERIGSELSDQPDVEARLRIALGRAYREIADYDVAEETLSRARDIARAAHEGDHEMVALTTLELGRFLEVRGRYTDARELFTQALEMSRRLEHDNLTLHTLQALGEMALAHGSVEEARPLLREAIELGRRTNPGESSMVATLQQSYGMMCLSTGEFAAAETNLRESLASWRRLAKSSDPRLAGALNNLALALEARGQLKDAEPLVREGLAISRQIYKGDHPMLARSANNLAAVLHDMGRIQEAEPLYREALEMARRLFAGDHQDIATDLLNVASVVQARGDLDAAEPLNREALAMLRRLFPHGHADVATCVHNLATLVQERGNLVEAIDLHREALAMFEDLLPPDHPHVALSKSTLASALVLQGKLTEAQELFSEALEVLERVLPGDDPRTASVRAQLAALELQRASNPAEK